MNSRATTRFTPLGGGVVLVNIMLSEVSPGGVGRRPLRDPGARDPRGVHRRADGRAHARVPGQEDRAAGDEAGRRCTSWWFRCADPRASRAIAVAMPSAHRSSILNPGPHGLTEVLYAFTSAREQQRQRVRRAQRATPPSSTPRWGWRCSLGRFASIVLVLALAGSLAGKRHVPASAGTFPTTTPLFVGLLIGVIADRHRAHLLPGPLARDPIVGRSCHAPEADPTAGRLPVGLSPALSRVPRRVRASSTRACMWRNPVMFVVEIGVRADHDPLRSSADPRVVRGADHRVAVAHRAVREPRRGGRRGAGQGAGRGAARAPARRPWPDGCAPTAPSEEVPGTELRPGDRVRGRGRRGDPRRRRRRSRASRRSTSPRSPASRRR